MKEFKSGKNRIIYDIGNGQFVIVFRNTISVGKSVFPKQIPRKGEISNRMSEFWFDQTQNDFPNHMISTDNSLMPKLFQEKKYSGRCMLVKKTQLLPVKCVVYGYLTGNAWEEYRNNNCIVNGKEFFLSFPFWSQSIKGCRSSFTDQLTSCRKFCGYFFSCGRRFRRLRCFGKHPEPFCRYQHA